MDPVPISVETAASQKPPVRAFHDRVLRNVASNWVGYLTNLLIGFLLAPVLVHNLGNVGYGVWALSLQIGAFISVLDFGIRIALMRYIAHHHAKQERDKLDQAFSAGLVMLLPLGTLIALVGTVIGWFLPNLFPVPPGMLHEARWTVFFVGLSIAVTCPGSLFSGALAAISRYDLTNARTSITLIARALLIWFFLRQGYGLISVAVIFFLSNLVGYFIDFLVAWRVYHGFHLVFRREVIRETASVLLKFSGFAFLLSISTRLLFWSDNVVVGAILGPAAVTYYAIGGNLIDNSRGILTTLTSILIPMATSMDARGERAALQRLLVRATRSIFLVMYPLVVGFIVLGYPFIRLWMGAEYAPISSRVLILLAVPLLFAPIQSVCGQVLYATNRHQFNSYIAIAHALVNLGISIYLAKRIGLLGVAWGTLLPALVVSAIILPWYTLRTLNISLSGFYWSAVLRTVLFTVPYVVVLVALRIYVDPHSWAVFFACVLAGASSYAILVWLLVIDDEEKFRIRNKLMSLARTFRWKSAASSSHA
jgi:O-antigen/teichoic acid export membrane protein